MDTPWPDAVVRYADHDEAVIDLHLPVEPNGNLVVLVHGGFWRTAYDRKHTRPMAGELARKGFVVATPEYRRVGPGGDGGWPATGNDVFTALARLPELLEGLGLSPDRTVVAGHSAGGHLALWLASSGLPIDLVVPLAPVADLREAIRLGLGSGAALDFLGEVDPDACDPMVLLDEPPASPIRIVHGVSDDVVPVSLSRNLARRHPWIELREVPGGHFEPIQPDSVAWPDVLAALTP